VIILALIASSFIAFVIYAAIHAVACAIKGARGDYYK